MINQETRFERRRALRTLLNTPLVRAGGPLHEEFVLIRRHADWLRAWCARNPGWFLHVDRIIARLRKTPSFPIDSTKPAQDPSSGEPFTRRRYVLFCLMLAVLEKSERQTVLNKLANEVLQLLQLEPTITDAGITLDLNRFVDRRDLVHAVRLLLKLGVLSRLHGDEDQFLQNAQRDVLYNVNRNELAALLNVQQGPSLVIEGSFEARIKAICEEPFPDSEDGRNRRLRSQLNRRLLDDPVLYYEELNESQLAYLTSQRPHILREIEEGTGLVPEIRREGIALLDEDHELTDVTMPERGTEGHHTLLLAIYLAQRARENSDVVISYSDLALQTAQFVREHQAHWRKGVILPGAQQTLLDASIGRLEKLRLISLEQSGADVSVKPRPAIARFAVGEIKEIRGSMAKQMTLDLGAESNV